MSIRDKLLPLTDLAAWRARTRSLGRRVVATNGCFDILHAGHVSYLEAARALGDVLLVGLNSDASVTALKGEGRPVNPESDRATVLAALESVSAVSVFPQHEATEFLALARPDVYVKGADYTLETMNPRERAVVESTGGRIEFLPFVAGKSTSALLRAISSRPA